jgi:hypothetical protein
MQVDPLPVKALLTVKVGEIGIQCKKEGSFSYPLLNAGEGNQRQFLQGGRVGRRLQVLGVAQFGGEGKPLPAFRQKNVGVDGFLVICPEDLKVMDGENSSWCFSESSPRILSSFVS